MNGLEQKAWYRAIKVLYIGIYILVVGIAIFVLNSGGVCGGHWSDIQRSSWIEEPCSFSTWIITLLVIVAVFELIKRVFFYIATGKTKD
ncbi:hypothetical protein D4R51_04490 [bacterium]|nr:MAG: hypothetical protein D4R51_04490 [bacterium]